MGWDHELGALLIVVAVAFAAVVYVLKRRKPVTGRTIDFEFGETEQSKAFFERNPKFWPAFERVMTLTNRAFGREWRAANRMEDVVYNLGETCRRDFLEIAFLAANGHGNLHIHATATSAFSREPNVGTLEEKNIHEAEVALIHATLILILVVNSQSETFSLGLDSETKAAWDDITTVWKDRPHGPSARAQAKT